MQDSPDGVLVLLIDVCEGCGRTPEDQREDYEKRKDMLAEELVVDGVRGRRGNRGQRNVQLKST